MRRNKLKVWGPRTGVLVGDKQSVDFDPEVLDAVMHISGYSQTKLQDRAVVEDGVRFKRTLDKIYRRVVGVKNGKSNEIKRWMNRIKATLEIVGGPFPDTNKSMKNIVSTIQAAFEKRD